MSEGKCEFDLHAPFSVQVDITSYCQLQCKYCCAMPFTGASIPARRCLEVLWELHELQVPYITLSGGEPFLHPEFLHIVKQCLDRGMSLIINTNGLLLGDEEKTGQLARIVQNSCSDYGITPLTLKVSLDEIDESSSVRGRNKEVINGIETALDYGLNIIISSVVHSRNIDTALSVVDKFYPRVESFSFFKVLPTFQTATVEENLIPSHREMESFWARAIEISDKRGINIRLPFTRSTLDNSQLGLLEKETSFCFCSITKAYVDPELNVYPCDHTAIPQYLMGNLTNSSFEKIWNSKKTREIRNLARRTRLCGRTNTDLMAIKHKENLRGSNSLQYYMPRDNTCEGGNI